MLPAWRFEFFNSGAFWVAAAAAALLVAAAGAAVPRARGWALLACSNGLLLAIPRFGWRDLLLVWGMAAFSWAVGRRLLRPESEGSERGRRALAILGIAGVLGCLALFKWRGLQELLGLGRAGAPGEAPGFLFLVGVSYFSFKAVHVVIESYRRSLPGLDPLTYLNYLTFFPAFVSGPIDRYGNFAPQFQAVWRGPGAEDLKAGAERIVHGLFKKVVLVPIFLPYTLVSPGRPLDQQSLVGVAGGLYAYAAYSYFDFSGYSDMAIGVARLLGIGLPENFSWPFLQRNIREFWTNWHMSLTSWLVDYIYWPIVRKLRNVEAFRTRPVLLSIVGMNATFLACGAWHGEAWNFIVWGAYHGLGISALNLYQRQKRRIRSRRLQRYFASRTSRVLGAVATAHYFALGMLFFALDLGRLRTLVAALLR